MTRLIMLIILGALGIFLLLNILAVVALSKGMQVLEKNISIDYIEHDVDLMTFKLNSPDSNLIACKSVSTEILGLKKISLSEDPTSDEIKNAQVQIIQTAHQAGNCYREQTWQCVLEDMGHCAKESLYALAESISISGRQMKIDFSEEEKTLYNEIMQLDSTDFNKAKVMALADRAVPLFKETLRRLNQDFVLFKKKNKSVNI